MVAGEREDDARRVTDCEQRIDERAEIAIDAQQLIVQLFRVGTVLVPDGVGCRERDIEQIGALRIGAELQLFQPGQRKAQCQLVHHRKIRQHSGGHCRIVGYRVRKQKITSQRLDRHTVWFRVRSIGKQRRPFPACVVQRMLLRIERRHPRRQLSSVVLALRECAVARIPVHITFGLADRQNRGAVLSRDGQEARGSIALPHPVEQRRATKPERRCAWVAGSDQWAARIVHPRSVGGDSRVHRKPTRHG